MYDPPSYEWALIIAGPAAIAAATCARLLGCGELRFFLHTLLSANLDQGGRRQPAPGSAPGPGPAWNRRAT
jgi:hypothetical protein